MRDFRNWPIIGYLQCHVPLYPLTGTRIIPPDAGGHFATHLPRDRVTRSLRRHYANEPSIFGLIWPALCVFLWRTLWLHPLTALRPSMEILRAVRNAAEIRARGRSLWRAEPAQQRARGGPLRAAKVSSNWVHFWDGFAVLKFMITVLGSIDATH